MTVAVVTDSAASLPPDLAAGAGVTVVPMWVTVGGVAHRDGELTLEEVMARVDAGVSTSGPTPGEIAEAVERSLGDDGALVLTIAHSMSSTFDAARTAARVVGEQVRVLDTATAAGAQGLVVLVAARVARAGGSLDEVEAAARRATERVRLIATVPGLERLARSGRVPGVAAWAGKWLGLQPVFEFRGGHARPLRPARSREAALERIAGAVRTSQVHGALFRVSALHAGAPADAAVLLDAARAVAGPEHEFVAPFSPVMVAHTGLGLVGLAWWWDEA